MIKLADIFSDNMIVQRGKPVRVFGTTDMDCKITVETDDNKTEVTAKKGKWTAEIPEMSVGKRHEIRVSSDNQSIVISNVLVGDVWIAAGQSNMEFPLLFDIRGIEEAKNAFNPNIRLYTCKRSTIPEKEKVVWAFERVEENPKWNICDENSALHFSAIGYYVAKLLNKELDIPIGVISANRGATKIESYIPECEFESEELSSYMVSFNNTKIPDDEAEKLFDEYYEKELVWMNNDGVTMEELVREIGVEPAVVKGIWRPRLAMTQMYKYSPNAPGILYKRFIEEQIAPMAVKGVLWYQGESNRGSENYADMFRIMAKAWRKALNEDTMPFYTVEVASHLYNEDKYYIARLRMEQWRAAKITPNTYITSTQDLGDDFDIHPNRKAEIGTRLANQILNYSYGKENYCDNPSYDSFQIRDGKIYIKLQNDEGFFGRDSAGNMEICCDDNVYVPAKCTYENGLLVVWSDSVSEPCNVRYCYKDCFKKGHLFNKAGLPLAPFATDVKNINK